MHRDGKSLELNNWLDEWSSKIDELDEDGKDFLDIKLFEKYTSFMMKINSFLHRNFKIED
jgi:hypothetical protein